MKVPDENLETILPPAWWWVAAIACWALTIAAFVASAVNGPVAIVVLGIPGSLGLVALGLWLRRNRLRK